MTKLTGNQLRQKYIDFFKSKGHTEIPPAPLVPENDPTTLFTSSGMQPLVAYLLGEAHPEGTRLVDSQPCIRMEDIEEVGDNRHTTFFEMLGNWSLGDYFKKDQLNWFWEFLIKEVGLDPKKLYVTVFAGSPKHGIPRDDESIEVWKEIFAKEGIEAEDVELLTEKKGGELGMQGGRIFAYDAGKNWWARVLNPDDMPAGEPGGPDSEVFYDFGTSHDKAYGKYCHPNCDCGRFLEIGNSVFMEYLKQEDGSFKPLPNKNVDFGGGFERILAAAHDEPDVFKTDLFKPIIKILEKQSDKAYRGNEEAFRVISDHMKAATFLISQGLTPSNKQQGYILRRLLRRAAVKLKNLAGKPYQPPPSPPLKGGGNSSPWKGEVRWGSSGFINSLVKQIVNIYQNIYLDEKKELQKIVDVITEEFGKFDKTLNKGLKQIEKKEVKQIDGAFAFDLFQTYGFPFELTQELVEQKGGKLDKKDFDKEFNKHQQLSRTASQGMFKGGLADQSENTVKYHTATHLLHASLRKVLGKHVQQKGSNITGERLRFDFSHSQKLTEKEIQSIEQLINKTIEQNLPVSFATTRYEDAIKHDALAFFGEKYPEQVKVYTIGDPKADYFSKEICGGPHVEHTGQIGKIKIFKETSAGAGVRRVYAKLT